MDLIVLKKTIIERTKVSHNDNVVTCQKFRELKGLAIRNNRKNKKLHEICFLEWRGLELIIGGYI